MNQLIESLVKAKLKVFLKDILSGRVNCSNKKIQNNYFGPVTIIALPAKKRRSLKAN